MTCQSTVKYHAVHDGHSASAANSPFSSASFLVAAQSCYLHGGAENPKLGCTTRAVQLRQLSLPSAHLRLLFHQGGKVALGLDMLSYILLPRWRHVLVDFVTTTGWRAVTPPTAPPGSCRHSSSSCAPILSTMSAKHHPDLVMCRKQPGISVGRLCERCT